VGSVIFAFSWDFFKNLLSELMKLICPDIWDEILDPPKHSLDSCHLLNIFKSVQMEIFLGKGIH